MGRHFIFGEIMVNTSETKNEKLKNNEATVQVMKKPKTFAQQVEIIKEKGFIIDNDTECIGFLKQANYYWSYVKKKYKLNTTNFLFLCNC